MNQLTIPQPLESPQFETPLQRELFHHALRRRFGVEKADLVFQWMMTPFDDLTPHQQRIVNLMLMWACLRNSLCGPIGQRLAAGGKSLSTMRLDQRPVRIAEQISGTLIDANHH